MLAVAALATVALAPVAVSWLITAVAPAELTFRVAMLAVVRLASTALARVRTIRKLVLVFSAVTFMTVRLATVATAPTELTFRVTTFARVICALPIVAILETRRFPEIMTLLVLEVERTVRMLATLKITLPLA